MSITPEHPVALDRRTVLRRAAAVGMLATPAVGLLGACATSGSDKENEQVAGGTKSEKNPLGVKEDAAIEVVIFNGGYGEKYATTCTSRCTRRRSPRQRSSTRPPRPSPRCSSRGSRPATRRSS
ncbi:hypothetical protein [Micromonospora tarensis]|uniref:hypothetical protein n=1 Tax=Micromonospora tarensis TaxID=2806100 RepID=UPI0028167712|nr:hypothetical protein [Micromonospora tarensis]